MTAEREIGTGAMEVCMGIGCRGLNKYQFDSEVYLR